MVIIRRALADTRQQLGGTSGIILLVVGLLGGLGSHGLLFGQEAMVNEWPPVLSALAAYGLLCAVFVVFNLAAAPFRIERERNRRLGEGLVTASAEIQQLQHAVAELSANAPSFVLEMTMAIWGGRGEAAPGQKMIGCLVRVKNVGRASSVLDGWALQLVLPDGESVNATIIHLRGETNLGSIDGQTIAFDEGQHIYEKTAEPIVPGDLEGGFLVGFVPEDTAGGDFAGCSIRASCVDVSGKAYSVDSLITDSPSSEVGYLPQVSAKYERREDGDGTA